jgi:ParB family transcriptional regulator, chromosome partitioning protein
MASLADLVKTQAGGSGMGESTESHLPIEQILDRYYGDSRELDPIHVEELVDSIAAVGLIQGITVDNKGRLLAGGHRRAAIQVLQETSAEIYTEHFANGVPVLRLDFDSADDEERALAIEAAENEKRRDYTKAEVRALADRFRAAGYRTIEGRPKNGQKSLLPALKSIVGKSKSTLLRYLNNDEPSRKTVSGDTVFDAAKASKMIEKILSQKSVPRQVRQSLKEALVAMNG